MKKFFLLPSLLVSLLALTAIQPALSFAFTAQDAENKFKAREVSPAGLQNALNSANMFHQLFLEAKAQHQSELVQASLLTWESKSIYFYSDNITNNENKKSGHLRGWDMGKAAADLLHQNGQPTVPLKPEYAGPLSLAFYWQGANMGKWGLANGIINSLRKWPELKETMGFIFTLGQKSVESYGPNRILGRSYGKLPFPLGDKNKALDYLQEAFEQTLDAAGEISVHSTNALYYAEALLANNKKEKARLILQKLIAKGQSAQTLADYNDERIPETKVDIAEARRILSRL